MECKGDVDSWFLNVSKDDRNVITPYRVTENDGHDDLAYIALQHRAGCHDFLSYLPGNCGLAVYIGFTCRIWGARNEGDSGEAAWILRRR